MVVERNPGYRSLELDMGNTRIKWRVQSADKQSLSSGAVFYQEWRSEMNETLQGMHLDRIRIASVTSETRNNLIVDWCEEEWQLRPEFAVVTNSCAGVTNGYRDFDCLGIDRWLAVLAAFHQYRQSCVIVDCGSAITVDLISTTGMHLGGYIAPGLGLMRDALGQETNAVKVAGTSLTSRNALQPGRSTVDAVNHALLLMVQGLVDTACTQLYKADSYPEPLVVLTGGDAGTIIHVLNCKARIHPDLVLDGLSLALP